MYLLFSLICYLNFVLCNYLGGSVSPTLPLSPRYEVKNKPVLSNITRLVYSDVVKTNSRLINQFQAFARLIDSLIRVFPFRAKVINKFFARISTEHILYRK